MGLNHTRDSISEDIRVHQNAIDIDCTEQMGPWMIAFSIPDKGAAIAPLGVAAGIAEDIRDEVPDVASRIDACIELAERCAKSPS